MSTLVRSSHGILTVAMTLALGAGIVVAATPASAATGLVPLGTASGFRTADRVTGSYHEAVLSGQVFLQPARAAEIDALIRSMSTPGSPEYHHWLARGQFAATFAPSQANVAAVVSFLHSKGLYVGPGSSPLFLTFSGSSDAVAAAFATTLRTYQNPSGETYFANATPAMIPAALTSAIGGVIGLKNTVRLKPAYRLGPATQRDGSSAAPACETPYVTRKQLYGAVSGGASFALGYAGGPFCTGLTPRQIDAAYGAPNSSPATAGGLATLAVFELSGYTRNDITTYEAQFYPYGPSPAITDVYVDGGPYTTAGCPKGDTCITGLGGDIEVEADIEAQLAVAPYAQQILVYQTPNDYTGQTSLDQYQRIANEDVADVVSSSWGECEARVISNGSGGIDTSYVKAENTIFAQMALQGQSMFSSEGDSGAFGCIEGLAAKDRVLSPGDPAELPYVTGVGGTSFESFNPGSAAKALPADTETVWNVENLCNESAAEGPLSGYQWCNVTGAGSGGVSAVWKQPSYQAELGTKLGNGYRTVPDVSANADEYTPYAEYCTGGTDKSGDSACASFHGTWFGIGGTSLSSPVWSAIIADRDGFTRSRAGLINYFIYNDAASDINDIVPYPGAVTTNDGYYPVTRGYDIATGLGSPKIAPIVEGK